MALDFVAGCIGGIAGVLIGHPLDTVKVKIQTQDFRNPIYKGTWHCFFSIVKTESIRGLYKGVSSPMAGVALVNAIVFGVYGNTLRLMGKDDILSHVYAGSIAGFAQSFICSPMELAKTRLQLQPTKIYKNCVDCLVKSNKTGGIRGVYKGLNITFVREVPAFGTYFYTYESLTNLWGDSVPSMLMAGGLAGSFSWLIAYPVDVIKSRLQADGLGTAYKYSGIIDCFNKGYKEEGYRFLIRGLNTSLIRAFPVNAVTFVVVDCIFKLLGQKEKITETDNNNRSVTYGKISDKSNEVYNRNEEIFKRKIKEDIYHRSS